MPPKPSRGPSHSHNSPAWPRSAACRRERPGYGAGRGPSPYFFPGAGPGATPRRGHGDRGVGGNRARHGMQVDHCGRLAAHVIAIGVPPPPTGGPPLGPQPRPHKGSVDAHAEPPQGVDDEPGCTVPAWAGAQAAHGPDTRGPPLPAQGVGPYGTAHRRGGGPGAGAAPGALPADPHPASGHVRPAWAARSCSAASRPHTQEAWWNSG